MNAIDAEDGASRSSKSVFEYLREMPKAAVDRLYGAGSPLDPDYAALGERKADRHAATFTGGRAASRQQARREEASLGSGASSVASPLPPLDAASSSAGWCCRAVLQALSPLAQHICLRLVALCSVTPFGAPLATASMEVTSKPVPLALVRGWAHADQAVALCAALDELACLHVVALTSSTGVASTTADEPLTTKASSSSSSSSSLGGAAVPRIPPAANPHPSEKTLLPPGGASAFSDAVAVAAGARGKRKRRLLASEVLGSCAATASEGGGGRGGCGGGFVSVNAHFARALSAGLRAAESAPWAVLRCPKSEGPSCGAPSSAAGCRVPKASKRGALPVQAVDAHMRNQWNAVLNFLVDPSSAAARTEVSPMVKSFLIRTRLIVERRDDDDGSDSDSEESGDADEGAHGGARQRKAAAAAAKRYAMGAKGYEFLLQDIHTQMWRFAEELMASSVSVSTETVLRFLFQLGFCQVGQDYPVAALSGEELVLLDHLDALGFVLRHRRESGKPASRFYPSSAACGLVQGLLTTEGRAKRLRHTEEAGQHATGGGGGGGETEAGRGGLCHFPTIVQTNFQVIAYTSNTLHLRMLGLFCQLRAVLPNAVVATITRKSFMDALEDGIGSAQIVSFLQTNAHPEARKRGAGKVVPETVADQLKLWEKERNRITYSKGVLHVLDPRVVSPQRFERLCAALEANRLLLWRHPKHQKLVVKAASSSDGDTSDAVNAILERA